MQEASKSWKSQGKTELVEPGEGIDVVLNEILFFFFFTFEIHNYNEIIFRLF